jgi:hypothetical protein
MKGRASAAGRPSIGVTYDGGDPALLERLLEVADYLEVAPDALTSRALTHQGRFEDALTRLGRDPETPSRSPR